MQGVRRTGRRTQTGSGPLQADVGKLGIGPRDGLAFEDSPKGVKAAREIGLTVVGIVSTHHPSELRDAGAALVVGDFIDTALYDLLDDPDSLIA